MAGTYTQTETQTLGELFEALPAYPEPYPPELFEVKHRRVFNSGYYTVKFLGRTFKLSNYQVDVMRIIRDSEEPITTVGGYWNILKATWYVRDYMSYYKDKIVDLEIMGLIEQFIPPGKKKGVWMLTDLGEAVLNAIEYYEKNSD